MSKTQRNTKVSLIRSDSKGIRGTIRNARHHAQVILPYIRMLRPVLLDLGFDEWVQGHNVHQLNTTDGRCFTLRAFQGETEDVGYIGIRLSLRLSRSEEHRLIDIVDISDTGNLITTLKMLSAPAKGELGRLVCQPKAA